MTLPEYCHLISQIEINCYSTSKLPKWLVRAFKHPRIDSNGNKTQKYTDGMHNKPDGAYTYSICESILQSYGYSLDSIISNCASTGDKISLGDEHRVNNRTYGAPKTEIVKYDDRIKRKAGTLDLLELVESESATKLHIERLVRKSMVYYLSLFNDYSHKYEPIIRNGEIKTNKPEWISKNSSYEMICSLRDCLSQLINCGHSQNEAVCITKEYSGIFSGNDVLITRYNVSFKDMLKNERIVYSTIYDEVIRRSKDTYNLLPSDNYIDDTEVVRSYLTNDLPKALGNSQTDAKSLVQGKIGHEELVISKLYVLKSLKLAESDEYDLNSIRIQGRSNCHKLFKCLEKDCVNILLNLKKRDVTNPIVKCVLSNFPILFSKVHDLRFNLDSTEESIKKNSSKICIRGLILPSVLVNLFEIIKTLNRKLIIKKPRINVKYNISLDDELYEKSLRISDKNRIYQNFMKNFVRIKKDYPYSYKTLKRFIPFSHFVIRGGEIVISNEHLVLKGIADLKSDRYTSTYNNILSIKDEAKEADTEVFSQPLDNTDQIIFLRDTLYSNLSMVKHTMKHIDGADSLAKYSTKSFLDESFCHVASTMIDDLCETDLSVMKCYLELYPDADSATESVMAKITPFNLTNLIWIVCYLMHCYGKVPFFDRKYYEQRNILDDKIILDNLKSYYITESNYGYSFHINNDILSFNKSLEYPLAQQSYIIHLANHINFNKGFFNQFGMSYGDYYANKQTQYNNGAISFPSLHSLSTATSLSVEYLQQHVSSDSHESISENLGDTLTSGWKTFLGKVKTKNTREYEDILPYSSEESTEVNSTRNKAESFPGIGAIDLNEVSAEEFKGYDLDALMQSARSKSTSKDLEPLHYSANVENITRIRAGIKLVNNSVNVEFGIVSSESRPHGRVHKCLFDFDSNTTFNDMHKNPDYNIINKLNDVISKTNELKPKQNVHVIFMFLCTNPISLAESNYIKLIKNVINSNLMVLTCDTKNIVYESAHMDENTNIQNYINTFKKGQFASVTKVLKKNGISYSFVISGDDLKEQISDVIMHMGRNTNIKLYGIPILNNSLYILNESCKTNIATLNKIKTKYPKINISHEIVRISWIFDSYFDGILVCSSNIPKLHKLVFHNDELVDAYSMEELINEHYVKIPPCLEKPLLGFSNEYRNLTFLWGFEIYLLHDQENNFVTPRDCMFYRKYCGINFKLSNNTKAIEKEIEDTIQNKLYSLSITDSDVNKFLSHGKIYTNSLVLSINKEGARVKRKRHSGKNKIETPSIHPLIGNVRVCFGGFDGIPILDFKWLYSTLNSSKPAPMRDYLLY